MSKINLLRGQSLLDICIQEYGSLEGIGILLLDNQSLNLEMTTEIGTPLNIRQNPSPTLIQDQAQMNYFRDNQITVANGKDYTITNEVDQGECSAFSDGFSDGFGCPVIEESFSDGFSDAFAN